ncbi:PIN domain-containing protein [Nocardia goodfellowii]|uniref:Ribonuclease VapC n=1 Tax=Nocardia goodfellowii TaxID=882446 RepID=A0ABS4QAX6_9NOCA|nr:type II toxin-antitoxin system VapC family toxin [Nocardia goodfellowii]MBP2188850.1 putative nucleic acid-binding protein [Nocardia goodfellowii]
MTVFLDTNILIRHFTQDPPDLGKRATAFLADSEALFLPDLILAETVYVLQSVYKVGRPQVALVSRALIGTRNIVTDDPALLIRTIDVYEHHRLSFADAYLVALAEADEGSAIASFDKGIDKATNVRRIEPAHPGVSD